MLMIVLRFAHVFFGALWVGMMAFQVYFLMPALSEAGPDAGKVMGALVRRRIPVIMPIFALITLISGIWLYQRLSGGNMGALMRTSVGQAFAAGGAAALLAFLLGIVIMRPAMLRSMKLAESRDPAALAEVQRLRARGAVMGNVVTVLLLFTLAAMAVARYL
jgi:uncharacterized membrane protein